MGEPSGGQIRERGFGIMEMEGVGVRLEQKEKIKFFFLGARWGGGDGGGLDGGLISGI